jgi:antitoxin (DNA-binding transcriptional repressor) of toxin-antitoxin stability system
MRHNCAIVQTGDLGKGFDMDMVTVRDFRTSPTKIRNRLKSGRTVVLTNNGTPIAVLLGTDAASLEDTLDAIHQARAVRAVARMQLAARQSRPAGMDMDEIDAVIAAARKDRKNG